MKTLHTTDTTSPIYSDALEIRKQVFINEQGVATEIEIDQYEDQCVHFVLYSDQHEAVATCRLFPLNKKKIKLQRMAVKKAYRGKDYGRRMIEAAEKYAKNQHYDSIVLGAQVSALGFYEKLSYTKFGDMFIEANIVHYHMKKIL